MQRRHRFPSLLAASAATLAAATLATTAQSAEFYAGKTVTVISPVPGGSGLDRLTRAFVRHWPQYIPGTASVTWC